MCLRFMLPHDVRRGGGAQLACEKIDIQAPATAERAMRATFALAVRYLVREYNQIPLCRATFCTLRCLWCVYFSVYTSICSMHARTYATLRAGKRERALVIPPTESAPLCCWLPHGCGITGTHSCVSRVSSRAPKRSKRGKYVCIYIHTQTEIIPPE